MSGCYMQPHAIACHSVCCESLAYRKQASSGTMKNAWLLNAAACDSMPQRMLRKLDLQQARHASLAQAWSYSGHALSSSNMVLQMTCRSAVLQSAHQEALQNVKHYALSGLTAYWACLPLWPHSGPANMPQRWSYRRHATELVL